MKHTFYKKGLYLTLFSVKSKIYLTQLNDPAINQIWSKKPLFQDISKKVTETDKFYFSSDHKYGNMEILLISGKHCLKFDLSSILKLWLRSFIKCFDNNYHKLFLPNNLLMTLPRVLRLKWSWVVVITN